MDRVCTGQQGVWWAREELNLRPLPCQQNLGNRCATRRFPRSAPTVAAKGKRSLAVKGNALFPTFCRRSVTITSCRLAAAMQRQLGGDANTQQLSSAQEVAEPSAIGGCATLTSDTGSGRLLSTPRREVAAVAETSGFGQPTCDPKGFKAARCDLFRASNRRLTPCQPAFSQVDLDSQGKVRWRAEGPRDGYVGAEAWVASRVDARPFL